MTDLPAMPPAGDRPVPARRADPSRLSEPATGGRVGGSAPWPDAGVDEVDIRDVWRALQRRWGTIASTALLATALVAAYVLLATPTWNARTLILVEEVDQGLLINPAVSALTGISGGGSQIETEMRLVQTRPVLEDVVDVLDLNFVVTSPRDVPVRRLFDARQFGRETPYGRYEIRAEGSGRYRVRSADEDTPALDVAFSPGDRVEIPGGWFVLGDIATAPRPDGHPFPMHVDVETLPFQEAVAKLSETISVDRPDPEAGVLRIGYRTTDRSLAYEVPNAVAERFIARRVDHQKIEAMSTVAFLENEAEDTRQRLERVEAELQSYREGQQIVAIGAEAEAQVSRLAALEGQRTQLEAERSALASLVDEIESSEGPADYRRLASFPTFFSNAAIAQLLVKLVEAEQDRTDRLSRLTPSHPDIVALDTRIAQLEAQLGSMGRNYLRSLSDQVAALDAALAGFGAELESIPEREIVAARISRQVDMLAELYTVLQTRLKEAQVKEAIDDSGVRIVEHAIEPLEPLSPRPVRDIALAMVVGLLLGVVFALARVYMDRRLDPSDRIDSLYGLPTMARIPPFGLENGREGPAAALVTLNEAGSVAAESFRVLRTNVGFLRSRLGADDLLITSPAPGDGKSITAANLAIALAQGGVSTVLVDADMRAPVQHAQFGVERSPGLSDYLRADKPVDGILRPTTLDALVLLPAGGRPPDPAVLLDSPAMDRLLAALRERFDAVVVDAPPILSASDSTLLAPRMDGVIIVVRAGRSEKDAIAAAIEQMRQVGAAVLGMVVNDARGEPTYRAPYAEENPAGDRGESRGVGSLLRRIGAPFS